MMDFIQARINMVESQLRTNKVTSPLLLAAFTHVPREAFLPPLLQQIACVDEEIALGEGRFLLEPMVFARLLQAAEILPTETVLVVGAGCGYGAAIVAKLAKHVVAIEENSALFAQAAANIAVQKITNIELCAGLPQEDVKFDVILIEGSVAEVPLNIQIQLKEGGRLLTIHRKRLHIMGQAVKMVRQGDAFSTAVLFDAATPFLKGFEPQPAFVF